MSAVTKSLSREEHLALGFRNPAFWVQEMIGVRPTAQQMKVLNEIAYPGSKIAIASGHGIGKSTMLAWIALWFLATRENAKIPCTAPTAHQLEDILWNELSSNIRRMHPWMRDQFHVARRQITIEGSDGFIVARTARPEEPEALQGFHGDNLLFIIDEAAGVDEKIFEVAYGALSTPKSRAIMTGNPTQLRGFFYKVFHTENSWVKFQFSSEESDIVDKVFCQSVENDYGRDSDVYRVRVLGQFPKAGMSSIIPAELVDSALCRGLRDSDIEFTAPVLGIDPAWEGSDRSVICLRRGRFAKILFAERGVSGDLLARRVMQYQGSYNAKYVFVDKTGVGASCCDFLRSMGVRHIRVSFAERPLGDMFLNKRAEIWWRMREWFQTGECVLTPHPGLKEDLIAPEYGVKENGKVFLESKEDMRKRALRSPDLGDALALTFSMPDEIVSSLRKQEPRQNLWEERYINMQRDKALGLRRAI